MIEKCNSTHARNHRKLRQAHIKKMVRNEDRSTQRFRTAKGIRPRLFFFFFFFRFLGHSRPWPQNQKKRIRIGSISGKHSTEGLHGKNRELKNHDEVHDDVGC